MKFWDTSAIVPLLVTEGSTPAVVRAFEAHADVSVWWGTRLECVSALARLERSQKLAPSGAEQGRARLDVLAARWAEVQPSEALRRVAQRLVRIHPLRAQDALQGAAALILAEQEPSAFAVVCLDDRLSEALRREGFSVETPR